MSENDYQSHLYESRNPFVNYVVKLRVARIAKLIGRGDSVLDAGCGEGYTTSEFASKCRKAVGVEMVPERIEKAKRIAKEKGVSDKTSFVCSDLFEIEKKLEEKFDVVVCSEVIEHVDEPKRLLGILARMGSGKIIITYPNEPVLKLGRRMFFLGKARQIEEMTDHKITLNRENVEEFAKELGLEITHYEKIPNLPLVYLNELVILEKKPTS